MLRALLCSVPVLALIAAGSPAADEKPDRAGVNGVVVKVDAAHHAVTVRLKDAEGKEVEKTFRLSDNADVTDESGKAVGLDALEAGAAVTLVEKAGRLIELRRARKEDRRTFDADRFLADYDRNKDGFIQREELPRRLRYAFDQVDTNKDGKLSREELVAGAFYLHPRRRPSDVVNILIEAGDADAEARQELQTMYDQLRKLDKNHDGKIDAEEVKEMGDQLIRERVDEIFEDLDVNHDGKISREEARGRLRRDFDEIDLNKDGFIDREELLKAARERAATRPAEREKETTPAPKKPTDR